jgi:ketosteroid isomerase-like protein
MDVRWKTVFGAAVEKEITTKDVFAMGDLAYETGSYSFTIVPEGKEARVVKGRYVEVWRKQMDGSWKMYRDIGLPE